MKKMEVFFVTGVDDNPDEEIVDQCETLRQAMRSPVPGIVSRYDCVMTVDSEFYQFVNEKVIGVNDALRARLH